MSEELTLIGDDATLEFITYGTEKLGNVTNDTFDTLNGGSVGAGKGLWLITAKTPGGIFDPFEVGDLFPATGTEAMILGEKAKFVSAEVMGDCSGWNCSLTAGEVEVTRIKDKVKKYRKGKGDLDGSVKGIFTLGITDAAGGLLNQFMKIVKKDATGTISVAQVQSSPIAIKGVVRDTNTSGETYAFMFAQIELYGIKLGAEIGNKQEFESKFRITGRDPVFYSEDIA